jgi:hypothetical protein
MEFDRHTRLKIALLIHKKTLREFAEELNVNPVNLWMVSIDRGVSARVTKAIDEVIESSEIMFAKYLAERNLQPAQQ